MGARYKQLDGYGSYSNNKTMSELATQISNKFLFTFEYLRVKSGVIKNLDCLSD